MRYFSTNMALYVLVVVAIGVRGPCVAQENSRPVLQRKFEYEDATFAITFNRTGHIMAGGYGDGAILLWDTRTGKELRKLSGHRDAVESLAFAPDDGVLASTGSRDLTARLWDPRTGKELRVLRGHTKEVMRVAFAPDGKTLATGSLDGSIRLWETETGKQRALLTVVPNTETGKQRELLTVGPNGVLDVTFSPDGSKLAAALGRKPKRGEVRVWNVKDLKEIMRFGPGPDKVFCVAFSKDGKMLAAGDFAGVVKVWSMETRQELKSIKAHSGWVYKVVFHPTEPIFGTGGDDGKARIWSATSFRELHALDGFKNTTLAFTPIGRSVAFNNFSDIELWDLPKLVEKNR